MNVTKLLGILALSGASAIFVDLIRNVYIRRTKYPTYRAIGVVLSLSVLGVLTYAISNKDKKREEKEGETTEYSGIIVDENLAKETCYCEPIVQVKCFAKGVIGALSKKQAMEFCPEKYKKMIAELTKEANSLQVNLPTKVGSEK